MLVIFMEIFVPVLSHFGFLTYLFSFANPFSPFFSILIIPEAGRQLHKHVGILSGLVREDFIGKGFIFSRVYLFCPGWA